MITKRKSRRGSIELVTTFLFVAIVAVLVLWLVFGVVMPRVTEGIKELFREHGERNVIAYQAVVKGCDIWWKTGNFLDVNMPDGLPMDFDNAGLNEPIIDASGQLRDVDMTYCNKAKVRERLVSQGTLDVDEKLEREFHMECVDKCAAILELHTACGKTLGTPSSDCYRVGSGDGFTMVHLVGGARPVRCMVEGC